MPYNGSVARLTFGPVTTARVRRWLSEGDFDLVHLHEPQIPSLSLIALWAAELPVVATFHTWYGDVIYIVAMLALGLHIRHGFWSAAQTLGAGSARRDWLLKLTASGLALVITAGFVAVPVGVMTGTVH